MITNEELWLAIKMLIAIDRNGNDGADIWDYQQYEQHLIEKYGETVKETISLAYAKTHENTTQQTTKETKYMAGINFDATQVAPNSGFAPVEKGKYPVVITQSEFKPTSNGAGKIIEFHCRVNGGVNNGRDIMFTLNWENASAKAVEIGHGQFSAICHAVNVLRVQDTQQLHNIPFMLEVDVTPDGKYNNLVGIYPISQVNAGQTVMGTIPQQQPQQAYVQAGQVMPNIVPQGQQQPYQQAGQVMPQQFVQQQPQQQPVYQQPTGQANPMAQYEQMAQPNNGGFAGITPSPSPGMQPQFVQQVPQSNDVPDWIKNQQLAAQGQPMGNQ